MDTRRPETFTRRPVKGAENRRSGWRHPVAGKLLLNFVKVSSPHQNPLELHQRLKSHSYQNNIRYKLQADIVKIKLSLKDKDKNIFFLAGVLQVLGYTMHEVSARPVLGYYLPVSVAQGHRAIASLVQYKC